MLQTTVMFWFSKTQTNQHNLFGGHITQLLEFCAKLT